jgi:hypothetical protein
MRYLSIALAAFSFMSALAHASHTVCASENLYYSAVRHDFGIQPPPGTELGKLVIVHEGKTLVEQTHVEGLGGYTIPEYEVNFVGPEETLSKSGSAVSGARVYRTVAVLSTAAPAEIEEIERTAVVCEETWAMVP